MLRRSSTVAVVAAAAVALLMTTPLSAAASTVKAVEYPVAAGIGGITVLTGGPDGTVWFTEKAAATIGHITPHGVVHQFPIPPPVPGMPSPAVIGIATGSDGALWFASAAPKAGRMTTAGVFSWFPLSSSPIWVAAGPDGNLWYTEVNGRIARVSTAGAVTEFPAPPSGNLPAEITAGPDGAMWFSEDAQLIGRITTSGLYSEFPLDHPSSNACLAAGPDGKVWIAEQGYLAAVSSSGVMKDHPAPAVSGSGCLATKGAFMWFTTSNGIGRMAAGGTFTTFASPSGAASSALCLGPDGHIWSDEGNAIARWVRGP
jgi:virginiamycin B lyase